MGFQALGGHDLLAVDGTGQFASERVHCDTCCVKRHRDGRMTYDHQLLAAVLVPPSQSVVVPSIAGGTACASACHRSHRGRNLPTVGERSGLVKTRTQGRAIGASAACSPAWLISQSTTASCTGCAALHADRGGPQNGPRRMLHVRTASASIAPSTERTPFAIQRTHPSERTPLPSPSPRQSPINFVVSSTTYTHIHRTQAIHYEK